jgi:hypothetical protein
MLLEISSVSIIKVSSTLTTETDDISETSLSNSTLTRLIAREDFCELE